MNAEFQSPVFLYQLYKRFPRICTDSRKITEGCIYVGIKGERVDGNSFAPEALAKGAAAAIVDNPAYGHQEGCFLVNDSINALQQIAALHRENLNIPFIAITGSNGKTTTKELVRDVLKQEFITYATPGNYNNELGVPLTLLNIDASVQCAVIEMGAKHLGDIRFLCEIVKPTHGLVTNHGKDHLEFFGSLENVRLTNHELFDYLEATNGTSYINNDDPFIKERSKKIKRKTTYGSEDFGDVHGKILSSCPTLSVEIKTGNSSYQINTHLAGEYNLSNVLAAFAVGTSMGIIGEKIALAIADYKPGNNRSQVIESGTNRFIMDAYNANPSSMKAALESFSKIKALHKIVILGDMLELGPYAEAEHELIIQQLKEIKPDTIVLVGKEFGKVQNQLKCHYFLTTQEAAQWFQKQKFENALLLLKGSRGLALEKILEMN